MTYAASHLPFGMTSTVGPSSVSYAGSLWSGRRFYSFVRLVSATGYQDFRSRSETDQAVGLALMLLCVIGADG
jgi:hypothetical protein